MIYSYLTGRRQRVILSWCATRISPWTFSFNIYINDLFFMVVDTAVCNCADDTAIFKADCQSDRILQRLRTDVLVLSRWFPENFIKLNEEKCHLLTFEANQDDVKMTSVRLLLKKAPKKSSWA